jgi:hypothetical protein
VIRVFIFPTHPEAVLFFIPDGDTLSVENLSGELTKESIREAVTVPVRIAEAEAGRWTATLHHAREQARCERAQKQQQREATEAAILKGSSSTLIRERSQAILRKHEVDGRVRELKQLLGDAKTQFVTRGIYTDRAKYGRWQNELESLKEESQALQTRLGQLRCEEKKRNVAKAEETFTDAARRLLDPETFKRILHASLWGDNPGQEDRP